MTRSQQTEAAPLSARELLRRQFVKEFPASDKLDFYLENTKPWQDFAEEYAVELVAPLKRECDREWKDETPEQVVAIACNAIYWRTGQFMDRIKELEGWLRAELWRNHGHGKELDGMRCSHPDCRAVPDYGVAPIERIVEHVTELRRIRGAK